MDSAILTTSLTPWADNIPELTAWFDSKNGRKLLEQQKQLLDPLLAKLFGYHFLQVSALANQSLCDGSKINHCIRLSPLPLEGSQIVANEWLPFTHEAIDVVFVHHMLESCGQPDLLLRELARVLIPSGHLIIAGINPYSLLAIKEKYCRKERRVFNNPLISARQLVDRLAQLNLAVESVSYGYHQLPLLKKKSCGQPQLWQLPIGGFYILHAVKQESRLTPLRFQNRARKGRIEVAAPSAYQKP